VANADGLAAMRSCVRLGRNVGIVSNNSEQVIRAFLAAHDLIDLNILVVGRKYGHPDLMKPNPWALHRAFAGLATSADRSVFIGDSVSDVEAARATHLCMALANKPGKRAKFEGSGVVRIAAMTEVSTVLSSY